MTVFERCPARNRFQRNQAPDLTRPAHFQLLRRLPPNRINSNANVTQIG